MRGKIGSHVGMMLSFLIFVTFIAFLYSVFQPAIKIGEDKSSILESIQLKIIQNTSANLSTASVLIEPPTSDKKCVNLKLFFTLMLDVMPLSINGATVIVKNSLEEKQTAYNKNDIIHNIIDSDLRIDRDLKEYTFFKIYYSTKFEKLEDKTISCTSLENTENPPKYTIGTVTSSKYMFEKDIVQLKDNYNLYYNKIKEDFNIPSGSEFWFSFTKSDGSSIAPLQKETTSINIFSEETPMQYVDSDANIQSGFINIKVW